MTDERHEDAEARGHGGMRPRAAAMVGAAVVLALGGCDAPRHERAIRSYFSYDFGAAREALAPAAGRRDDQVLLNNLRLGQAALADGDYAGAGRAFERSFDLLGTAGLNRDRTVAAVLLFEGLRIWKGDPFEQALAYHSIATLYAVTGDWENARAAAANALFRLTDFGADRTTEELVSDAARNPHFLETGYTAVDTNFALGFLMEATAADVAGGAGSPEQFDAALAIDPDLAPLVEALRARRFDTLLIVDYGKGPTKIAYGPDDALAGFVPQDEWDGPLTVTVGDEAPRAFGIVCDVNRLAADHRWRNLEDVRRAKSAVGDALMISGVIVAQREHHVSHRRHARGREHDGGGFLAAGGLWLAGLLLKAGARADTRYLEFVPQLVYLVPLRLSRSRDVRLRVDDGTGTEMVLADLAPGALDRPRAVYVRLHGTDGPQPAWLTSSRLAHGNDHRGVGRGDYPWILGGTDVSIPTRAVLAAYQDGGHLRGMTASDLLALYDAEGIAIDGRGPGDQRDRHILEGGRRLFAPSPDSMGYKRLMYTRHRPYVPRSSLVRNVARGMRVRAE